MKYFYIICIALSSFFTYKSLSAQMPSQQYAFFMPGGSLQQNSQVSDIRRMRPRYLETSEDTNAGAKKISRTANKASAPSNSGSMININSLKKTSPKTTKESAPLATKPKYTLPYEHKPIAEVQELQLPPPTTQKTESQPAPIRQTTSETAAVMAKPATQPVEPAPITPEIAAKMNQYHLDDTPATPMKTQKTATQAEPQLSEIDRLKQKSVNELLTAIPYPDSSQPKFKQLYALYGLELRVLQRRGNFPANPEQEKALAKANSIKRFEVQ